jgi:quinol monooxygenase YgiN
MTACAADHMAQKGNDMAFGLIGKYQTTPGDREKLITLLKKATENMPGCIQYILAEDLSDLDVIWITELWETEADHTASLKLPKIQAAIQAGRPYITGMTPVAKTRAVAGI